MHTHTHKKNSELFFPSDALKTRDHLDMYKCVVLQTTEKYNINIL